MSPRQNLLPGGKAVNMAAAQTPDEQSITELLPLVRRVVAAKVRDSQLVDDLVQETLLRVMAARSRVEADTLAPYATVTARNLVASLARSDDRARRMAHLLADDDHAERPEDEVIRQEQKAAMKAALARLNPAEREMLLAHEVHGQDTATLAAGRRLHPGSHRRPAQPRAGQVARGVPTRARARRAADRSVPAGAAGPVHR